MNALRDMPPLLVPRPRRVALTGGRVEVAGARDAKYAGPGGEAPPGAPRGEWYRLRIGPTDGEVVIEAADAAGERHARATLRQLLRQYGSGRGSQAGMSDGNDRLTVPGMVIEDWPMFASRGYMLDVSRNRVPTVEHLHEIVDLLALLKYNHLQLYTEHTFAYAGHEEVWRKASPITAEEVRRLDAYCRERGIELAANQNCFGHLSSWLRRPGYAELAETHGEWRFEVPDAGGRSRSVVRRGAFSLCPTDRRSLELIEDLLGQLLPCFSSPLVNIGCDETFDVGFGRSAEAVKERGRACVYFDHVNAVAEIARQHGKRAMFWADILLRHPEAIGSVAEDMIALAWGYEEDTPWGEWLRVLAAWDAAQKSGATWVCPGTSSWRSITGRTSERRANIAGAAREGLAGGAQGFLLTDWGDMGHHQQWPVSLNAIAQGAQWAWSAEDAADHLQSVSLHVWNDPMLRAAEWMDELGDVDLPLRRICGRRGDDGEPRPLRNASALFTDLHLPLEPRRDEDEALRSGVLSGPVSMWQEAGEHLAAMGAMVPALDDAFRREAGFTVQLARFAAQRAVWRRSDGRCSAEAGRLADELCGLIEDHRRLWMVRSREGGLDESSRHYERIMEELRR